MSEAKVILDEFTTAIRHRDDLKEWLRNAEIEFEIITTKEACPRCGGAGTKLQREGPSGDSWERVTCTTCNGSKTHDVESVGISIDGELWLVEFNHATGTFKQMVWT